MAVIELMGYFSSVNPAGDTSPQKMSDGGTVMHHVPPNMAEISLHKRQRIRLIVAFLNSAQCFGIIVTVQLQPVVESLGLFT